MSKKAILVNINRCTGCWTCSTACRVGHNLTGDKWLNYIRTIGSGHDVDEPGGQWPDLYMKWMPIYTSDCSLCVKRTGDGLEPYCSYNCPAKALIFGDLDDPESLISIRMKEFRQKGYNIFQIPEWEHTRPEIYYAEKKK